MEEKKDSIQIYWIESHKSSEELKSFMEIKGEKTEIRPIFISNEMMENYISSVYFYSTLKIDFELILSYENILDKKTKYNIRKSLNLKEIKDEHLFLFDIFPLKDFSPEIQFELYLEMIEKKFKQDNKIIKEILCSNSRDLIKDNKNYFDFLFYISVLVDGSSFQNFIQKFILHFRSYIYNKKVNLTAIRPKRFELIKSRINDIEKNPQQIMEYIEENRKIMIQGWVYESIFLFYYYYDRNRLLEMLKNQKINNDLYSFISTKKEYFLNLKFNYEEMNSLIKFANNLESIEIIFSFNNDFVEILKVIIENLELIKEIRNKSLNKKSLNLDKCVIPKQNDILPEIVGFYISILHLDEEKIWNKSLVYISPGMIENYVEYNDCIEYKNLLIIKNLIQEIKKKDNTFKVKNFEHILHRTGLFFIDEGKFSNDEIISFFMEDDIYKCEFQNNEKFHVLTPLQKIDLKKITKDEIEKWKKIKWLTIFKNQENKFFSTLFDLIKNFEDFEKIFDLLIENKHFINKKNEIIKLIKEKLIKDFNNEPYDILTKNINIIKKITEYSIISK